jgi:hypothetical protein
MTLNIPERPFWDAFPSGAAIPDASQPYGRNMLRRIVVSVGVLVIAAVCGTALALVPLWLSAGTDLDPAGGTCWIEQDPGSGPSAIGIERAHGGLVPYTACVPVEDNPRAPKDEAFDDAARRALAGEAMPVSKATLDHAKDAEAHPFYRGVWPYLAAFASVVFAVTFGIVASAVGKRRAARRQPAAIE